MGPVGETNLTCILVDRGVSLDREEFVLRMDYEQIFRVIGDQIIEIVVYIMDHEGRKLERIAFDLKKIKKNLHLVEASNKNQHNNYVTINQFTAPGSDTDSRRESLVSSFI
jgi:hypothetical protein